MADYDWFRKSDAELEEEAKKRRFEAESNVSYFQTSTAVGTKFYYCLDCGTVLVYAEWAVVKHRTYYHPVGIEGRHKALRKR